MFSARVPYLEKLLFTKHLSVLTKSGINITESLETLASQTKSSGFKNILFKVLKDIENGQTLAKSLGKFPIVFDQFYISLVEVGEASGTLEENLEFLAHQMSKDYTLRKKVQGAMMYPALVLSATVVIGGFVSLFVLPKLVDFFGAFQVELPLPTKILLFFANTMKNYGLLIALDIFVTLLIFSIFFQFPKIKPLVHALLLKIPLFGEVICYDQIARFSRNFGTLLKSGIPVVQSLEVTSKTLSNLKFKNDIHEIAQYLDKGKNIGEAMDQNKFNEFPPIVVKMVKVGEKSGKLEETLQYLSEFYDEEIDSITKNLSTILEPALLLVIGVTVGFVAIAIISPIYELTGSIGNK